MQQQTLKLFVFAILVAMFLLSAVEGIAPLQTNQKKEAENQRLNSNWYTRDEMDKLYQMILNTYNDQSGDDSNQGKNQFYS